jgi:hypothetical protein
MYVKSATLDSPSYISSFSIPLLYMELACVSLGFFGIPTASETLLYALVGTIKPVADHCKVVLWIVGGQNSVIPCSVEFLDLLDCCFVNKFSKAKSTVNKNVLRNENVVE